MNNCYLIMSTLTTKDVLALKKTMLASYSLKIGCLMNTDTSRMESSNSRNNFGGSNPRSGKKVTLYSTKLIKRAMASGNSNSVLSKRPK